MNDFIQENQNHQSGHKRRNLFMSGTRIKQRPKQQPVNDPVNLLIIHLSNADRREHCNTGGNDIHNRGRQPAGLRHNCKGKQDGDTARQRVIPDRLQTADRKYPRQPECKAHIGKGQGRPPEKSACKVNQKDTVNTVKITAKKRTAGSVGSFHRSPRIPAERTLNRYSVIAEIMLHEKMPDQHQCKKDQKREIFQNPIHPAF